MFARLPPASLLVSNQPIKGTLVGVGVMDRGLKRGKSRNTLKVKVKAALAKAVCKQPRALVGVGVMGSGMGPARAGCEPMSRGMGQ